MRTSRRRFLTQGLCGCGLCALGTSAWAKLLPTQLTPIVTRDYEPQDVDERGLWHACDQLEEALAASNLRITDPALNESLKRMLQRLLGDQAGRIRLYPMRSADFNAGMFPNGMMIVNSGLLARARNEAQVAAVLGHECGHYLRRHTLQSWRSRRSTSAIMAFVAVGGAAASAYTGTNWYEVANAINTGLLMSVFQYSRDLESEADAYGLQLMTRAGYEPDAAAQIWKQLIEERQASAAARKKKYKDNSTSSLSTHPPSVERMERLAQTSKWHEMRNSGASYGGGREEWLAATAAIRPSLIDEQVKLNDPGASLYLLNSLATDGWTGLLRYYEGEVYRLRDEEGDAPRAASAYAAAIEHPDSPPEAFRADGYAKLKQGRNEEGKQALRRYLEMRPEASDAEMVRFTLGQ